MHLCAIRCKYAHCPRTSQHGKSKHQKRRRRYNPHTDPEYLFLPCTVPASIVKTDDRTAQRPWKSRCTMYSKETENKSHNSDSRNTIFSCQLHHSNVKQNVVTAAASCPTISDDPFTTLSLMIFHFHFSPCERKRPSILQKKPLPPLLRVCSNRSLSPAQRHGCQDRIGQ